MTDSTANLERTPDRLASLDAFRGFTMLAMASEGFGISDLAERHPGSSFWRFAEFHASHVPWVGCAAWDLIQPAFMFMVGVALAYSFASRRNRGDSDRRMFWHAAYRSIVLVLLGVFLRSNGHAETQWRFDDVVSQIGFGYIFLFLLWDKGWKTQLIVFFAILIAYWCLFAFWPLPDAEFDYAANGADPNWEHDLQGFAAHWDKNTNPAQFFDAWFLNLFPRSEPFQFNDGGYVTLNFVPSLATMILGLIAGGVMRSEWRPRRKVAWLVAAGLGGILAGCFVHYSGACPIVKRIWTPSWVLFSGGCTLLLLAAFYQVIDVWQVKSWAFPGIVVGMNSLAIYVMTWIAADWITTTLNTHFNALLERLGPGYRSFVEHNLALLVMWLILYWMYRRKIFLKI